MIAKFGLGLLVVYALCVVGSLPAVYEEGVASMGIYDSQGNVVAKTAEFKAQPWFTIKQVSGAERRSLRPFYLAYDDRCTAWYDYTGTLIGQVCLPIPEGIR